jgi:epsilon-lactone hydrolase
MAEAPAAERPIDAIRTMLLSLLGGPDASIAFRREQSALFAADQPAPPPDVRIEATALAGVPAERITVAGEIASKVFLHLHGGGYVLGDPSGSRGFTTALARAARLEVISVDYRLAPEHPFPAAVEDAVAAYSALLERGVAPARIAIGGESAGGGLVIAALVAMRDSGLPMPACAVALSPWTDLTCSSPSYLTRAGSDPLLTRNVLLDMAAEYLAGQSASAPLASPLTADLKGLPPLLIQVGEDEVLLDDAVSLAGRAREAGVTVELQVWPEMIHVWQMFSGALPEADLAIAEIANFVGASREIDTLPGTDNLVLSGETPRVGSPAIDASDGPPS